MDVSLLRAPMVTLSDPYRRLASQGGLDQGVCAGPFELKVVVLLRQNDTLGGVDVAACRNAVLLALL